MAPIKAVEVTDIEDLRSQCSPGSFEFTVMHSNPDQLAGMVFICPCGCGSEGYLAFAGTSQPGANWRFDGNREAPTLIPSVFNKGLPCQWHGWLRNGEWVSC